MNSHTAKRARARNRLAKLGFVRVERQRLLMSFSDAQGLAVGDPLCHPRLPFPCTPLAEPNLSLRDSPTGLVITVGKKMGRRPSAGSVMRVFCGHDALTEQG
ncbi:hypothetical protein [Actinomadura rugatobispora]|uniref:Uncharacterized protein n=1 Tax=Actinomadura rugatobispora TaxID=1994 RepID=A0ABW1A050_9ACTN|nr:hypothetical protein GCM10010200_100030 [Actinomadura rugatobispora]